MNIISRHSWLDYGLVCVLQKPRLFLAEHMCYKSALLWQQDVNMLEMYTLLMQSGVVLIKARRVFVLVMPGVDVC